METMHTKETIDDFKNYLKLQQLSPRTIYQYLVYYKLHHKNFGRSLAKEDVNAFLAMYNHKLARSFLKKYAEFQEFPIVLPRVTGRSRTGFRKGLRYISHEDYIRLIKDLNYVDNKQLYLFLRLLFECGMRISEICNIERSDIDIEKGRVKVTAKGSSRLVYIPEDIKTRLFHYILPIKKEDTVFRYGPRTWQRRLARYSEEILGKKFNPHSFRHGCATYLYAKGMDLRSLQAFLGHKSLQTVEIYTHPSVEDVEKKWQKIMDKKEEVASH